MTTETTGRFKMTLNLTLDIPMERIADLLCCALEGGSNYWYVINEFVEPTAYMFHSDPGHNFKHLDYPLNPGGALIIGDIEDSSLPPMRLDLASIQKGLTLMFHNYGSAFDQFREDSNEDAHTGDIFLQLCCFGEVIYG